MNYFVTGATGFIGRFVVQRLLKRRGSTVYVLVRPASKAKFEALRRVYKASDEKLIPVWGDVTDAGLTDDKTAESLKGEIDHVFHLAAVYDMNMDDETGNRINNEGTRNVVNFTNDLGGDVILHHASSIAVAGSDFEGVFTEKMFDEGQTTRHPYYRTKFESERIVREETAGPWRVYRPGMVVGASDTGEMDKIDGPYYLFPYIKRIRDFVPKWLPLLGVEGGLMPIAPVDYVADAMIAIAHKKSLDNQAFHLVQQSHDSVGRVMEIFFDAAHGPGFARKFELPDLPRILPRGMSRNISKGLSPAASTLHFDAALRQMSQAIGVPVSALGYLTNKAMFDDSNARAALKDTDIRCTELKDYAGKLWEYWETYMDFPEPDRRATKSIRNKVVMITGASSGIGLTSAKYLAMNGARVVLIARGEDMLRLIAAAIRAHGGEAHYYPCDLTNLEAIDQLTNQVIEDLGHVDVLINNAGRSIRRAVMESLERFHDFERTMQLNYFSCVRLITNLLPSMVQRKSGHIVNISSIGCLANAPRFSAYVASKSALDAFSRCLSAEVKQNNVSITTIYMPLVRTPMIAPTKIYDYAPVMSVDEAAQKVLTAVVDKPKRMKTPLGQMAELNYALWPKVNDFFLSKSYQLFPTSAAAKGQKTPEKSQRPSAQGIALAQILRGAHL